MGWYRRLQGGQLRQQYGTLRELGRYRRRQQSRAGKRRVQNINSQGGDTDSGRQETRVAVDINTDRGKLEQASSGRIGGGCVLGNGGRDA